MFKVFVAASITIASLLSITSIADAGSIASKSTHHTIDQTQLQLSTKQPQSSVSQTDIKGIRQAIVNRYQAMNKDPEYPSASGAKSFLEVKEIKLTDYRLSSSPVAQAYATVTITEKERYFAFGGREVLDKNHQAIPKRYEYTYRTLDSLTTKTGEREMNLVKRNGKWIAQN